jgi:putative tryptophan/tyrosine transport system substrate-binding protein
VAVIVASAIVVARAAKAATTTIPIIFLAGGDPVATGLVASLDRPGTNLTGIALLEGEMVARRLQLLRELIPNAARFGVLADPNSVNTQSAIANLEAAAPTLGLQLLVVNASTDGDLEPAFATFSQQRVSAILVGTSTLLARRTERLAALAAQHALPAMFAFREHALAGGLISYGTSLGYGYRQLGIYTGHILNGDKPADLPVQRVTRTELVINLKTAKALGVAVPLSLRALADEVIE